MLYGWMRSLVVYLIFAGAVINLSPSGNYKKHIRLFTGLVAIIILMKPISYIFSFDEREIYGIFNGIDKFSQYSVELEDYEEIYDYYDISLREGIRLELRERGFLVEQVSMTTDKNNEILQCTVYVDESSDIERAFEENQIKSYINEVYNLSIDNIYVVRR